MLSTTVTTVAGVVPMVVLAPLVAFGFLARAAGCGMAASRGVRGMPWTPRLLSWLSFGVAIALLGLSGSLAAVVAFGAFVALDATAAALVRGETPTEPRKGPSLWSRVRLPLLLGAYLAGVAAFHVLVGVYLPYGVLITWSLLALAFAFSVRAMLVGPKADEPWLLAPRDHRLHERREEAVPDPYRQRASDVLDSLRRRGDAGAFLAFVREAARAADLGAQDLDALERRIAAAFARAGTHRDEDVRDALAEVERALSLKVRT